MQDLIDNDNFILFPIQVGEIVPKSYGFSFSYLMSHLKEMQFSKIRVWECKDKDIAIYMGSPIKSIYFKDLPDDCIVVKFLINNQSNYDISYILSTYDWDIIEQKTEFFHSYTGVVVAIK